MSCGYNKNKTVQFYSKEHILSFYTIVILIVLFLFNAHSLVLLAFYLPGTHSLVLPGMVGHRTLLAAKTGSVDDPVFQLVGCFLYVFNMFSFICTILCNKA